MSGTDDQITIDSALGWAADMEERQFFGWDEDRDDLVERVERRQVFKCIKFHMA